MHRIYPPYNIQIVSDETANRAIDGSVYTNSTGRTMFVGVYTYHQISVTGGSAAVRGTANTIAQGVSGVVGAPVGIYYAFMQLVVRPGKTYHVSPFIASNGTNNLYSWIENY